MEFYNVLSVQDVSSIIERLAKDYELGVEEVPLIDAIERIVATDYYAPANLPEFNRSTVDGYAVISRDIIGASDSLPGFLECDAEVGMGEHTKLSVTTGRAVYVPTGGMIPSGADGVVMLEYVQKLDAHTLVVNKAIAPGENITLAGDDVQMGDLILAKGKKVSAYDIGLLAAVGIGYLKVFRKPSFAIISTGDEIIDIHDSQSLGQIRDVNGYALCALIKQLGGKITKKVIVKDDFALLQQVLGQATSEADIVLISGGSSVGTRDYTKQVIESSDGGKVLVHGIAIKPGKPTILGQINSKLIVGLPGHPASALIIFNIFVKKYMMQIQFRAKKPFYITATLGSNVHSAPGKETYQMVELIKDGLAWKAVPLYGKSGMMTLLSKASGYIRISEEKEGLIQGEQVDVYLLQEVEL